MIVYISNFLNQHQYPLSLQFYELTKGNYRFVEIEPQPDSFKNAGYPTFDSAPFTIQSWKSVEEKEKATKLILNSDVVIFEAVDSIQLIKQRLNSGKLTFECGERWLKKGLLNLLSPRLIKSQWLYHTQFYNKPLYRLCASAFAASDLRLMHSYKNRCFKWGYFTEFKQLDVEALLQKRRDYDKTRFITVARLIDWKRNDLIIKAARILKTKGYAFEINIYGSGPKQQHLQDLISQYGLDDDIVLRGNLDNNLIIDQIQEHNALILASNRQEGWGAVVNEAMSNACPVIGSDQIGSVPYLIDGGINGLIFRSGDYNSLAAQMEKVITSKQLTDELSIQAYETMRNHWSPKCAATNFIKLVSSITESTYDAIINGPCSPA